MGKRIKKSYIQKGGEVFGILLLLLLFFGGTFLKQADQAYQFRPREGQVVFIPSGTSLQEISELLGEKELVKSPFYFEWYVRLVADSLPLQAGEFFIPAGISLPDLVTQLQNGKTVLYTVTIPEGLTSQEIQRNLYDEKTLEGDMDPFPEGTLLPETYHYHRPQSRQGLIDRLRAAQEKLLTTLWAQRAEDLPLKTPQEAVVLASIVERETSIPGERGRIAGVFLNRLRLGMPLQSDPTVRYGLYHETGYPLKGALTRLFLQKPTSYNTYLNLGLPPGPICHPGRASLEAVLQPEPTQDLYFVADGQGGHVFSKTYQEHQKNHQAWRRLRKQKTTVPH